MFLPIYLCICSKPPPVESHRCCWVQRDLPNCSKTKPPMTAPTVEKIFRILQNQYWKIYCILPDAQKTLEENTYVSRQICSQTPRPLLYYGQHRRGGHYAEFEGRSNRLAQLLRAAGLGIEDHYSVFMENNARYLEACAADERAGLYYLYQPSYGRRSSVYHSNSESQVLITSAAKQDVALAAAKSCPRLKLVLVVDSDSNNLPDMCRDYAKACAEHSDAPISDERLGTSMLYSSGTTDAQRHHPSATTAIARRAVATFSISQPPLGISGGHGLFVTGAFYHSAPQAAVNLALHWWHCNSHGAF